MIKYALIASVFALGCGSAPLGVENNAPDSGGGNAAGTGGATSQGDTGGASNSTGGTSDTGGVTGSGGDTSNSTGGTVSTGGADNSGGDTGNATGGSVSTGGSVNETGGSVSTGGDTSTGGMTSDTGGTTSIDEDASTGGVKGAGNGNDSSVPPPVCTPASCVLTQGYWKNHPDWAVQSLEMGGVTYSKDECLALLNFSSYTDGSVILAKQLIAALLNGGACDPNILATVKIAQGWMASNKDADGTLPYGTICVNSEDTGCTAIAIGAELDRYNSGLAGVPACK